MFRKPLRYHGIILFIDSGYMRGANRKFYELSKLHHPDRNRNDPLASDRFVRLSQAYRVLSNPRSRKGYDNSLRLSAEKGNVGGKSRMGPAGGRAASGLSWRRTTPKGPPPSYHSSQGTRQGFPESHFPPGLGIRGQTSNRTDDVPHFDWESKYRQHHGYQIRNRTLGSRTRRGTENGVAPSPQRLWVQVLIVGNCILLVVVGGAWIATSTDSFYRKRQGEG